MQLKKKANLQRTLATATCSLIATTMQLDAQAKGEKWEVNATGFFYQEVDRISVYEEILSVKKELGENEYLSLKRTLDIMTGASPTGEAEPQASATFTSPSGSSLSTASGESPLGEFQDIRTAYNLSWQKPLTKMLNSTWTVNYSYEYDYSATGLSGLLSKDLEGRRTTINYGVSGSFDRIKPTNGVPIGGTATTNLTRYRADNKFTLDLLLGITRVLNRRALGTLTYMRGTSSGYLNDPYKVYSLLNSDNLTPSGTTYFEHRPSLRRTNSVHTRVIRNRSEKSSMGDVVDFSYRYYWDSWDVKSHTAELRYRQNMKKSKEDEHVIYHLRLYRQFEADFYRYGVPATQLIPEYVSADYRLSSLATATVGIGWGQKYFKDLQVNVRGEFMYQWYIASELNALQAVSVQGSLYYQF